MRNLALIFVMLITVISCQYEEELEGNSGSDAVNLFLETPDPELLGSPYGLYTGVFNSFDTTIKGEIMISLGNKGVNMAQFRRVDGSTELFYPDKFGLDDVTYSNSNGSFTANINDNNEIIIAPFIYEGKTAYIDAYKNDKGGSLVVAFGAYLDPEDTNFQGNWDLYNMGGTSPEGGWLIERLTISTQNMTIFHDANFEPMIQSCGAGNNMPFVDSNENGGLNTFYLLAPDQISNFNNIECQWRLWYRDTAGIVVYRDDECQEAFGGSWSWNGRNGVIDYIGSPFDTANR